MSKASAWVKAAKPLSFTYAGEIVAAVSLKGNLIFDEPFMEEGNSDALWLPPQQALALAHWILDTFGDST